MLIFIYTFALMKKTLLKSKLHRINVTQVELNYEGSCAVDKEFLELACLDLFFADWIFAIGGDDEENLD